MGNRIDHDKISYYRGLVRPVLAGRRLIMVCRNSSDAAWHAALLREAGAEPPLAIVTAPGEAVPHLVVHEVPIVADDPETWGERVAAALDPVGPDLAAALDRYDPDRSALVYLAPDLDSPRLLDRRRYGWRRREWAFYEDKTNVDAFWERAGVPSAGAVVVPVDRERVLRAFGELDRGDGVVVSGDSESGTHGSAQNVRRLRTPETIDEVLAHFAGRCKRVRVAPFLSGIPCSIHGIVFPDGISVFRPMELLVLRPAGTARFMFTGTSLHWDGGPARESIRDFGRRVGEALRAEADYRGGYAVDGVLTADGFRPTEINARLASGIGDGEPLDGLPLFMLSAFAQEGEALAYRPDDLSALVIDGMDAYPFLTSGVGVTVPVTQPRGVPLVDDGDGYRPAAAGERADATVTLRRTPAGAGVKFSVEPGRETPGRPMGPRLVSAYAIADRVLGTGIGPLESAVQPPLK